VDWNGAESHQLRHRQFDRLFANRPECSILDLGCGFGDFLTFLRDVGHRGAYTGYDISPSMIDAAKTIHGETEYCRWIVGDVPSEPSDFAVASGIFNVKGDVMENVWQDYVVQTIDVLAGCSRLGFAFNVLSLASDPEKRRPHLYYGDAPQMFAHCQARYGRSIALLHDYGLYEFTIIVRH
jgi:SAM-dependent methyltransferase